MINFKWLIKRFPSVWPYYFNNKWPRSNIKYRTKTGGNLVDVKTVLNSTHPNIVKEGQKLRGIREDDIVAKDCLRWVIARTRYKYDIQQWNKPEYWQEAPETYALRTGDCEDFSILLYKLMEAAGIPHWRMKLCAGWVKTVQGKGGHCYLIYLANDFEWYILDGTYWPLTSLNSFKKIPHRKRKEYISIWWTFNKKFSWIQKDTILK